MDQPKQEEIEFDWLQLKKDMDSLETAESRKEKLTRKIKENPLVPIGCLATALALSAGLWSFRHGKRKMSQNMMRARVAAQGFTVMALVIGLAMGVSKK